MTPRKACPWLFPPSPTPLCTSASNTVLRENLLAGWNRGPRNHKIVFRFDIFIYRGGIHMTENPQCSLPPSQPFDVSASSHAPHNSPLPRLLLVVVHLAISCTPRTAVHQDISAAGDGWSFYLGISTYVLHRLGRSLFKNINAGMCMCRSLTGDPLTCDTLSSSQTPTNEDAALSLRCAQ